MSTATTFPTVLLAATLSYVLYRQLAKPEPPAPLPPGPKPLPILGNVADLSTKGLWLLAERWAKQYGPSPHPNATLIGTPMLTFFYRSYHVSPCIWPGTRLFEYSQGGIRSVG